MKERITVSIEQKLLSIVDNRVKIYIFASRSHGFEAIIAEEIRNEKAKKR